MKIYHVDGGAAIKQPGHIFHSAYFSVLDNDGKLVHYAEDIGDHWPIVAEFLAIKWAVTQIKERPILITSDCTPAIVWARKGAKTKTHKVDPLDLEDVELWYTRGNLADMWNGQKRGIRKRVSSFYNMWRLARFKTGKSVKLG